MQLDNLSACQFLLTKLGQTRVFKVAAHQQYQAARKSLRRATQFKKAEIYLNNLNGYSRVRFVHSSLRTFSASFLRVNVPCVGIHRHKAGPHSAISDDSVRPEPTSLRYPSGIPSLRAAIKTGGAR